MPKTFNSYFPSSYSTHFTKRILELRDYLYHLAKLQIEDEEKRLSKSSNT